MIEDIVEAIQVNTLSNDELAKIKDFIGQEVLLKYAGDKGAVSIVGNGTENIIKLGDFIVKEGGYLFVYTPEVFERKFGSLDESPECVSLNLDMRNVNENKNTVNISKDLADKIVAICEGHKTGDIIKALYAANKIINKGSVYNKIAECKELV